MPKNYNNARDAFRGIIEMIDENEKSIVYLLRPRGETTEAQFMLCYNVATQLASLQDRYATSLIFSYRDLIIMSQANVPHEIIYAIMEATTPNDDMQDTLIVTSVLIGALLNITRNAETDGTEKPKPKTGDLTTMPITGDLQTLAENAETLFKEHNFRTLLIAWDPDSKSYQLHTPATWSTEYNLGRTASFRLCLNVTANELAILRGLASSRTAESTQPELHTDHATQRRLDLDSDSTLDHVRTES